MRNYPEKIETAQREIAALNVVIQNERERIDFIEADLTIEIHAAKGEDGKPLFSNDALRKASFVKRCLEHERLIVLNQGLQKLETDRLHLAASVERMKLEYKYFLLDREMEIAVLKNQA